MSDVRLPGLNDITIDGYVARDPETKDLPNGGSITEFRLGHTDYWRTKNGEKREDKVFVKVSCFGFAQKSAQKLKNGYPVVVQGKLYMNEWTNKDGQKRTDYSIKAARVAPLQWDNHNTQEEPRKPRERQQEEVVETDDIPF